MQYFFNKGFSFSESHLILFCPRVMESNNYSLISIDLLKKGNSLLGQPSYINEKFCVYCWDVFPSNIKYTIQKENGQICQQALQWFFSCNSYYSAGLVAGVSWRHWSIIHSLTLMPMFERKLFNSSLKCCLFI